MKKTESSLRYCLFDTEFGAAGIVWSDYGVCSFQLPQASQEGTREKLTSLFPTAQQTAVPEEIKMLTRRIERHLRGEIQDFSNVRLDLTGVPPFHQKIYQALQKIPNGRTVSYNDLAFMCGSPGAARAVGQAMAKNPLAIIVPCHRVVSASGQIGGFSAYGGQVLKTQLLKNENALPAKCRV